MLYSHWLNLIRVTEKVPRAVKVWGLIVQQISSNCENNVKAAFLAKILC